MLRRTRIVATLGPATDAPGVLEQLLDAGLDVARINFSHGSAEELRARIARLRELAAARQRTVAVLADLPGPKLRALLKEAMPIAVGASVSLARTAEARADVHLTEPEAVARIGVGHRVLFDDGRLQARVAAVAPDAVTLTVEVGGVLKPNKGINLPDSDLDIPAVTARDRDAIQIALEAGVDWFALSFVRDAGAARELRRAIRAAGGGDIPILAKIERPEGVKKSAAILIAFDGIMVARGDLGVEIPLEQVPHAQKRLIQQARDAGKPVITATDMLDSMRENPRPTRAEVSDVANAVYDGSDAVMLSGETAAGKYPVEAISCMNRILLEAETHQIHDAPAHVEVPRAELTDHITHAICRLAADTRADAIVTPTLTGFTARLVARHRPKASIIAVPRDPGVLRQLAVVWGVEGVALPRPLERGEDSLDAAVSAAARAGLIKEGSLVIVSANHPIEGGPGLPTIRVVRIGEGGRSIEP